MKSVCRLSALIFIALLFITTTPSLFAYQNSTIYAQNEDISYDLDLNAVASLFGESRDLADFEWRLNDPNLQISNLDLNGDYRVDYLRVIETTRNGIHLIVIQAVVGPNMYQDVATIEVSRGGYDNTYVQIVGDPYLYGYNYIVEPYYVYTPVIFNYFWGPGYHRPYYSHYRWGYYPRHYRPWRPMPAPYYRRHVYKHINKRHRYRTTTVRRNTYARQLHKQVRRNDYARRYPNRSFAKRQHHRGKQSQNRQVHHYQTHNRKQSAHQGRNQQRNMQKSYNRNQHSTGNRYQNTTRTFNRGKGQTHNRVQNNFTRQAHRSHTTRNRHNTTNRHTTASQHPKRQSRGEVHRYQNRKAIQSHSLSKGHTASHRGNSRAHSTQQKRGTHATSKRNHSTKNHTATQRNSSHTRSQARGNRAITNEGRR